ncbi:putative PGG domain, ankyrin repeat-containing domain superfamily [Helianthus anomalus]
MIVFFVDIALKILEDDLKCAETNDALGLDHKLAQTDDVLGVLARKPYAFIDRDPHFFSRILKPCKYLHSLANIYYTSFVVYAFIEFLMLYFVFYHFLYIGFGVHVKERESEAMQLLKIIWKNTLEMSKEDVDKKLRGPPDPAKKDEKGNLIAKRTYSSRVLFVAAEMGNTKFVVELIRQCPDLIWKINDNNQSIFHIAVSHRHESIYNLLHEIGSMKDLITPLKDPEGNNMLHLVGKNAEKNRLHVVSGVVFQMQWELLWFKEVEAMIPPSYRERKNAAGKTPRELFTENHKELVSRGEKWMRATANQCMVVAALIATIVFGVAFSIPGGYDQKNGFPMFIRKEIYIAFVIADAISLIFSSASILMFLSIVTSRYDEQDFFEPLPRKLMIGLATLFLSIMTMMIAFSFSFFVLYHNKLIWVPIVISVLAAVPVILYAKLQYALLVDVYHSIYGSRYIFKPKKPMLYNQNPKF